MCTIDWTALGTCAQAVFVGIATGVGIWQFIALNKNLRIRNTLSILEEYYSVRHRGTGNDELTVAQALPLLAAVEESPDSYAQGRAQYQTRLTNPLSTQYLRLNLAYIVTVNYYSDAARLWRRKLIDFDLFLDAHAYTMTYIKPIHIMRRIDESRYDLSDLEAFVEEAGKYLEKHPALLPEGQ